MTHSAWMGFSVDVFRSTVAGAQLADSLETSSMDRVTSLEYQS